MWYVHVRVCTYRNPIISPPLPSPSPSHAPFPHVSGFPFDPLPHSSLSSSPIPGLTLPTLGPDPFPFSHLSPFRQLA